MATGGRKTQIPAIHALSVQLTAASPLSGVVGVLPAGALTQLSRIVTSQAFNSAGGNLLNIGLTPGGGELVGVFDMTAVARAGVPPVIAASGPFAAAQPVYYSFTAAAPPTAGVLTFWLEYLPGPG